MLIGDLQDTLMNMVTFAFIGAVVWLLRRPLPSRNESSRSSEKPADDSKDPNGLD
ncbi:MAG: hypothetical protein R3245_08155 [Kiloniellales bacterium]|nr:hypothetical protein [Kiloniellales bacterium]